MRVEFGRFEFEGDDMRALAGLAVIALALICGHAHAADEDAPNRKPVKAIADARLSVGGQGILPLYVSSDWSMPLPAISRAIIVLHGPLRNSDHHYISSNTPHLPAPNHPQPPINI